MTVHHRGKFPIQKPLPLPGCWIPGIWDPGPETIYFSRLIFHYRQSLITASVNPMLFPPCFCLWHVLFCQSLSPFTSSQPKLAPLSPSSNPSCPCTTPGSDNFKLLWTHPTPLIRLFPRGSSLGNIPSDGTAPGESMDEDVQAFAPYSPGLIFHGKHLVL